MFEIIPSPGTEDKDWTAIEHKIELVRPFIRTLHIDITDGKFVPNTTFMDPAPFKKYADEILLEVHLMTENPLQYLKPFANAGFKRFIGQIEKMPDVAEFVAQGQLLGEVGLAIDGPTSVDVLSNIPLDDLDCVLLYTGEQAGKSGGTLLPERLEKVKELRSRSHLPIEADGGISDTTIVQAKEAGITRFVVTSFIFNHENPQEQFKKLQKMM